MDHKATVVGCVVGLLICFGPLARTNPARGDTEDSPETIELIGIVRDFNPNGTAGGHPDFAFQPGNGLGHYAGNIATSLDDRGKPVFTGDGAKITRQWRDSQLRQICYCMYEEARDDVEGQFGAANAGGISSVESFEQWYRDVRGVNMSAALPITLSRRADGVYVFDDRLDPFYADLRGFFPIDGRLLGNAGADHNYHFTFELHTRFVYDADAGQFFEFTADDGTGERGAKSDVSVFINDQLVADLSGVHAAHDQHVDVSRVVGLTDGEPYRLDLFFAARYETRSSFRITTNLPLESMPLTTVSMIYD